jgi:D-alanyl-D-alanine carboxypeptidase (penicillin-binding protein 5/6)
MVEASTGRRLYDVRAGHELAIASTTKIMTALVTLEHARLGQVFTEPYYYPDASDSQIGLVPGQRMSVHDLLIALLLPSADDAAEDLAYGVGHGSIGRFVAMMNVQARRLGLRHTHYSTPIGLDTPGNYSTASDLIALTRYVLRTQPFFRRMVALPRATIRVGSRPRLVSNLNGLVGRVPWIHGVKTGHTLDAGYVLVGTGTRRGMTLISAVLGASSEAARESDTLALLRYGFARFRLLTPVRAGATLSRPAIQGYPGRRARLIATDSLTRVFARSDKVRVLIHAPTQLTGPVKAGTIVGTVVVRLGRARLASIPLRLAEAVPAPPAGILARVGPGGFTLLLVGLLLVAGGVLRVRRRERQTAPRAATGRPA